MNLRRTVRRRDARRRTGRRHAFFTAALAAAASTAAACSQGNDKQRANAAAIARETTGIVRDTTADTIAVPAAAVDTTVRPAGPGAQVRVGAPGAGTAASGSDKATGVDTPITRRIRSGAKP
ncbi:MAG TPA: hypothetical protein VFJ74_07155 [Gemmatimonadaceae bacterium]|nr:hypothetical protein [Gemmatimonadaceae bacterium]